MEDTIPECEKCGANLIYVSVSKNIFRCPRCDKKYKSRRTKI